VRIALLVAFVALGLASAPAAVAASVLFNYVPATPHLTTNPLDVVMVARWALLPLFMLAVRRDNLFVRPSIKAA